MLVNARLASGLTQVQVAAILNKPQSYVSKYENGERRLDFAEFIEISEILGVNVHDFVEEYRSGLAPSKTRKVTR